MLDDCASYSLFNQQCTGSMLGLDSKVIRKFGVLIGAQSILGSACFETR